MSLSAFGTPPLPVFGVDHATPIVGQSMVSTIPLAAPRHVPDIVTATSTAELVSSVGPLAVTATVDPLEPRDARGSERVSRRLSIDDEQRVDVDDTVNDFPSPDWKFVLSARDLTHTVDPDELLRLVKRRNLDTDVSTYKGLNNALKKARYDASVENKPFRAMIRLTGPQARAQASHYFKKLTEKDYVVLKEEKSATDFILVVRLNEK